MTTDNSWTAGFGTAPARKGGAYFAPGIYDVTITAIVKQTSRDPKSAGNVLVIVETTIDRVVQSYDAAPHPADPAKPGWAASNKEGERVSTVNNFSKHRETALSNVKGTLLAVLQARAIEQGQTPPAEGDLSPAQWERTLVTATEGAGTAFAGTKLRVHATRTLTKAREPFTPLRWEPIPFVSAA